MYLDYPFDIGQCASLAINNPHYHVYHFDKHYRIYKYVCLVQVDVPIGINFVNGQIYTLNASVICVIVKYNKVGHKGPLYVHTVHLRHSFNYFLTNNAN